MLVQYKVDLTTLSGLTSPESPKSGLENSGSSKRDPSVTCFQTIPPTVLDDFFRKTCSGRIFFHGKSSLNILLTMGMHYGHWEHSQTRTEPETLKNHDF